MSEQKSIRCVRDYARRVHLPLSRFRRDESGQAAVLTAICLVVLLMFVGLAIDVGALRAEKQRLEIAADAAVLAAGLEVRQCSNLSNCPALQSAAISAMAENGYPGATLITNCSGTPTGTLTVMISVPPCAHSSDPNYGNKSVVELTAYENASLNFSAIAGVRSMMISARAEASPPMNSPCIYALDPSGSSAISFLAGVLMRFNCGIVDESTSSSALTCLIGIGVSAPSIKVTGGASGLLCGGSAHLQTNVPPPTPRDPMSYLPKPTVGSCGSSAGNIYNGSSSPVSIALGGTYIFNPGVYCGGISITAAVATNITFNPGVYVLKSAPGPLGSTVGGLNVTLTLLSNIQGSGVTFYNVGPVGGFNITASSLLGLSNVALSAPTTGAYSGVLFYQDAANTSPATVTANLLASSKIEGAYYLPTATLSYNVSAVASTYTVLVAKDISFNVAVATTFGNDFSALTGGSPIFGNQSMLVQ